MKQPWQGKGYEDTKLLPDGRAAGLSRLLFGGRICVGGPDDDAGYSEAYDYGDLEIARRAFDGWTGGTEPTGWIRHIPSYRRRPTGDPGQEYVAY
jgi:hypothetical protein